jgi:hypothetical protein
MAIVQRPSSKSKPPSACLFESKNQQSESLTMQDKAGGERHCCRSYHNIEQYSYGAGNEARQVPVSFFAVDIYVMNKE